MVLEVYLDDVVRLRKAHPCGGWEWAVVRVGADIGLKCQTCGHRVLLQRSLFERRLLRFVRRAPRAEPEVDLDLGLMDPHGTA